jgi:hypothetical protein
VGVGNAPINPQGSVKLLLRAQNSNNTVTETFAVVDDTAHSDILLTGEASEKLGLIERKVRRVKINHKFTSLIEGNRDLFEGIGKAKSFVYSAQLVEEAVPVCVPSRRVAYAMMDPLKKALEEMEKQEIISKVTESTDWCSPLVIATKSGGTYESA